MDIQQPNIAPEHKAGEEVTFLIRGRNFSGIVIPKLPDDDNFDDITGQPLVRVRIDGGPDCGQLFGADKLQTLNDRYKYGDQFIIHRKGGDVIGTLVVNATEYQFDDTTAERLYQLAFTDIDGIAKKKLFTAQELEASGRYNYAEATSLAVEKVIDGYRYGDQFVIQRTKGEVIGELVPNSTEDKFDNTTGKRLYKIHFTDTDRIEKAKWFTEQELDALRVVGRGAKTAKVLDGGGSNTLKDTIEVYVTPKGYKVAVATDIGKKKTGNNEDRVLVDAQNGVVFVVDGMGGQGGGDRAAAIIADELGKTPKDVAGACQSAGAKIDIELGRKFKNSGACVTGIDLDNEMVYHVGDTRCIIFDGSGKVVFQTKDQSDVQNLVDHKLISEDDALYHPRRNVVLAAIKSDSTYISEQKVSLKPGYRAVLISDGVGDNLTPAEIWRATKGKSAEDSIGVISDITDKRMENFEAMEQEDRRANGKYSDGYLSEPKPDNRAIAIIDM